MNFKTITFICIFATSLFYNNAIAQDDDFYYFPDAKNSLNGSRFYGIIQTDLIVNTDLEDIYDISISGKGSFGVRVNAIGAYRIVKEYFSIGAGIAYDANINPDFSSAPAFLDFRILPSSDPEKMDLYDYFQSGKLLKLQRSLKKGNFYRFGAGIKLSLHD